MNQRSDQRNWTRHPLAAETMAALAFVLFLGSATLVYPFGSDQGEYGYIGSAVLAGKVSYHDIFNIKPPLTHVVHEAAFVLFGRSMLSIRLLDLIWQCATAFVILLIANRIVGRRWAGGLAAALYAIWYYSVDFWSTAQTDGFLVLPASLAVLCFLTGRENQTRLAFLLCGVGVGIAVCFKDAIGLLLPGLMLLAFQPPRQLAWRNAFLIGVGFCLPVAVGAATLAAQGALGDFVSIHLSYVPFSAARADGGYAQSVLLDYLHYGWHHWSFLAFHLLFVLFIAIHARTAFLGKALPICWWWLATAASLAVQNKFYDYHVLPMFAPQAILTSSVIFWGWDRLSETRHRKLAFAIPATLALYVWGCYVDLIPSVPHRYQTSLFDHHRELAGVLTRKYALESVWTRPDFNKAYYSAKADLEVASYLRDHSQLSDQVFIWGFEPTVYFLAQRACASRFIYNMTLYGDRAWPGQREELMDELKRTRPLFILVAKDDALDWVTGTKDDSATAFQKFDSLKRMVAAEYHPDTQIQHFMVYRRNDPPQGQSAGSQLVQ